MKIVMMALLASVYCKPRLTPTSEGFEIYSGELESTCLNGVKYYVWSRSITPAYHPNGKIITCQLDKKVRD